jgi:hypothetical protein
MVDGNTQASKSGQWSSFIGTKDTVPCIGQKVAQTDIPQSGTAKDAEVWIFMSAVDKTVKSATAGGVNFRTFPFDTSLTTADFFFRGYGSGLKTAATGAVILPIGANSATLFTQESLNGFTTANNFVFATGLATITGETGQATGVVSFKLARSTGWGGTCCKVANACKQTTKQCDLDQSGDRLKLFSTNVDKLISHAAYNPKSSVDKDNALVAFKFTGVMDMPAHLTTVRGRGGLGSSTQKLCDIFW